MRALILALALSLSGCGTIMYHTSSRAAKVERSRAGEIVAMAVDLIAGVLICHTTGVNPVVAAD